MSLVRRAASFGVLILALLGLPSVAAAKTIMIFAPHPDDEALVAAGRMRAAVTAGDTVKVVVVTNGDINGVQQGLQREGESVAAAQLLGLTEQDVIFLGYPDGSMLDIYNAPSPTDIITSAAGQTSTYGNRGLGGMDFHTYWYGRAGPYNHVTVAGDIQTLLTTYLPDEIYTVSNYDVHRDHQATALFVTEALVSLKRSGSALSSKLYQSIVHVPALGDWPNVGGCAPSVPFPPPQMETQLDWKRLLRSVVPVVPANLKCQVISQYATQATPWLLSWARKDEFFWLSDFGANLAITAQVTVSSENTARNQGGLKAVDGVIDGAPHDPAREWVTSNQLSGAWIQLGWPSPVSVAQVNLHDRPNWAENILAGTLSFSDGTSIPVGALPSGGKVLPVTFSPKTVTWVRFTIDQAEGTAAGLSEIQVLGFPATSTANVAPHFIAGPAANADTINSLQTANFVVAAHDLNGDAVQYQWSADGGSIQGSSTTAVFTPPAVAQSTVFTISAQILDGRGGSASNVGFVTVIPAVDGFSVSPTTVIGGDTAQGMVTLANVAPAGGLSVPLSSSNPAAAAVPASVTVPAGASSASFPVTTAAVSARTTVTLSANINGTSRSATLIVNTPPGPPPAQNLLLSSESIGDANWGNWGTLSTTLNYAAAPDGTQHASRAVVTRAGGHALAQQVSVAENTTYTFAFYARNNGGAAAAYSVYDISHGADIVSSTPYLSSISGSTWAQVSVTFTTPPGCTSVYVYPLRDSGSPVDILLWRATLTVIPPIVSSLALSAASVTGGSPSTGTVTLNGPAPAGGAQVTLSSSDPAATVPSSVTVPAGGTSASFSLSTSAVATSTPVTISASYGGATLTASLTVIPPIVSSLALSPTSVVGGPLGSSTGTVTLSAPAPAGGAQVTLSSSNTSAATVPSSVTVPAGATSATFTVNTSIVVISTTVTISASYRGSSRSANLTISL